MDKEMLEQRVLVLEKEVAELRRVTKPEQLVKLVSEQIVKGLSRKGVL